MSIKITHIFLSTNIYDIRMNNCLFKKLIHFYTQLYVMNNMSNEVMVLIY